MKRKLALFVPILALVFATGLDAQCCGNKAKAASDAACQSKCESQCQDKAVAKTSSGTLTTGALVALMHAKVPMTLVDARAKAENPIPGAKTLCGKSMACSTYQAKTLGNKDRLIVTYCAGPKCKASSNMAAKLRAAGYTNVVEYREGVAGWKALTAKKGSCSACPSTGKNVAKAGTCPSTGKTGEGCSASSAACPASAGKKTAKPMNVLAHIDARGLKALRAAKVPMVLIDARTGKWDDNVRIPGAIAVKNCSGACWSKPDTYKALVKDKNALVVTYCGQSKCPLSSIVANKLRAAGYTNVIEYKAGLADWQKHGFKTINKAAGCCSGAEECSSEKGGKCSSGGCGSKAAPKAKKSDCSSSKSG